MHTRLGLVWKSMHVSPSGLYVNIPGSFTGVAQSFIFAGSFL